MTQRLHVRGVVLPEGDHRDLWVVDGRISTAPVADATTVGEGWILPGLVDAHCHIGLDAQGGVDEAIQEEQAVAEREAGVLLARDCGVPVDTRWIDTRDDLPRIIRAGRHIARPKRYIRNFGIEIEPDRLVDTVVEQARRGDGWVKLVGDWIDRSLGDLAPCWPAETLKAAIDAAHAEGARVTAHVFGEDALPDLLAAGIDCIEHGTGLTDDLAEAMAERQVALVPTLINIDNFPSIAEQATRFPVYAAHIRALHRTCRQRVRAAYEAGVAIYAGTDAGGSLPHGQIAREVAALVAAGLPAAEAVGAACWRARAWLGQPDRLLDGAPADLVVLDTDPRVDPGALARPRRVVLRGAVTG